jgi:hypothetical protein
MPFNSGRLGSGPSVAIEPDGDTDVFWKGTDGRLWEMRHAGIWHGARWLAGAGRLGSPPVAAADCGSVDHVFWTGTDGTLWELSNPDQRWALRSVPFNSGKLGSPPGVAIHADGEEDVFWKGSHGGGLYEWSYTGHIWRGPDLRRTAGKLGSQPAVIVSDPPQLPCP